MKDVTIKVNGMSCHHCKNAVESEVKGLKGVDSAVVDLNAGNVKVTFDETRVTLDDIYDAIDEAGYEPVK
ncbi:copper ion binding protein [Flexistipes sinusarabici DSM 4947]|uniref:Copper ion binding protein n=2 Tax=Flexistipes sinusarabici TaxID=2352 RepID=F8E3Q4_FLESM|nr:copper chaperone CopZ [Flexistipes sinusarabici]AEI14327.1 copper ion binding protein [Flexistipes sinusarabici DSM 4947]HCW93926.1 copper chaperone [Flexistipes sinusarabici]